MESKVHNKEGKITSAVVDLFCFHGLMCGMSLALSELSAPKCVSITARLRLVNGGASITNRDLVSVSA